jgi:hypothetical protein
LCCYGEALSQPKGVLDLSGLYGGNQSILGAGWQRQLWFLKRNLESTKLDFGLGWGVGSLTMLCLFWSLFRCIMMGGSLTGLPAVFSWLWCGVEYLPASGWLLHVGTSSVWRGRACSCCLERLPVSFGLARVGKAYLDLGQARSLAAVGGGCCRGFYRCCCCCCCCSESFVVFKTRQTDGACMPRYEVAINWN